MADWARTLLAIAGVMLVYGIGHTHLGGPPPASSVVNPFPPDERSVSLGHDLYGANCVTRHGTEGLGDGPAAAGLDPPPADLVTHVPMHSDGELLLLHRGWLSGERHAGLPRQLTDDDIWNPVTYLRALR